MVGDLLAVPRRRAVARRPLVPPAAAGLGGALQPRPRRQRRAEDDGHHRRRAAGGRPASRSSTSRSGWCSSPHAAIALGTLSGGWRIIHTMGSEDHAAAAGGRLRRRDRGRRLALHGHRARRAGQHHAHHHRRDRRRRRDAAAVGRALGRGAAQIVWAWVLTIPASALIAAASYYLLAACGLELALNRAGRWLHRQRTHVEAGAAARHGLRRSPCRRAGRPGASRWPGPSPVPPGRPRDLSTR